MAINVNQLSAQLRMMPDQALQRMAMMYKNDPYIFPMVISEDMARKKMRSAAQMQAAQGEQPKVVDQAIMSMGEPPVPGIAALPAPNMQSMADGGIAGYDDAQGYADGGNVVMSPGVTPSYQRIDMTPGMLDFAQHSEPVLRMAGGGVPGYAGRGENLIRSRAGEYAFRALPQIEEILALDPYVDESGKRRSERETRSILARQEKAQEQKAAAEAYMGQTEQEAPTVKPKSALEAITAKPATPEVGPALREPPMINPETGRPYSLVPPTAAATAPAATREKPAIEPRAQGAADVEPSGGDRTTQIRARMSGVLPGAATAAPAMAPATDIPVYAPSTPEQQAAGIAALSKAPDEATQKAYAELRGMYEPERKEIETRRGQRAGEAILRAGLSMLGGTSPYAGVNIGKGAIEGLNAYQEAQRYDDQAARALRQAEMSMRLAQRQEEAGNRRDAISLFGQAEQAKQAAASSGQQAQQIRQTGQYQQGTLAIMQQNADTQSRKVSAYISALDAPRQEKNRMMQEYGKIQTKVLGELSKDPNFLTLPADKQAAYRERRMREEIGMNPFLSGLLFQSAPSGKVRDPFAKDDEEE